MHFRGEGKAFKPAQCLQAWKEGSKQVVCEGSSYSADSRWHWQQSEPYGFHRRYHLKPSPVLQDGRVMEALSQPSGLLPTNDFSDLWLP